MAERDTENDGELSGEQNVGKREGNKKIDRNNVGKLEGKD